MRHLARDSPELSHFGDNSDFLKLGTVGNHRERLALQGARDKAGTV